MVVQNARTNGDAGGKKEELTVSQLRLEILQRSEAHMRSLIAFKYFFVFLSLIVSGLFFRKMNRIDSKIK